MSGLRILLVGLAGLLGLAAVPAAAGEPNLSVERAAIARFQLADQRLQDVGWQLARGNADFCARVRPSVGLQLQDLASYGEPEVARAALGLRGDFAVQTAARGSPAARHGGFRANREITGLGRVDPNAWHARAERDWRRLTRAHNHLAAILSENGQVRLRFANGARAVLTPQPICATRFELASDGKRAMADGSRVVIGVEFPGFSYDEARFAAVVAHELAHNILRHSAWLDRVGRKQRNVRRAEREADRLMPWLLANAGYDPEAAVRFMESWGPRHDGGLFRSRTHDGWDERAEFIAAEIPRIRALMGKTGKADWSMHFERDIEWDEGYTPARQSMAAFDRDRDREMN